jgi:addiction module HigA family antidote
MRSSTDLGYTPDYAIPPGATLQETLESLGLSQAELAERTGRPKKTINEIIKGKAAITPETALQFERVLGVPASLWSNLEQNYRAALARQAENSQLAERISWLDAFPLREMISRGWIQRSNDKLQQLRELLGFFGVASPEAWTEVWSSHVASYRRTAAFESNLKAITAWLRRGELESQLIRCRPFHAERFRRALSEIRALTVEPPQVFEPLMVDLCASSGVAVVFIKALPRTGVYGATRWLNSQKALIQLSLRYRFNDQFWFSFFHEAGHVLKHGKRQLFVETGLLSDEKEKEADRFAAQALIPQRVFERFVLAGVFDERQITSFARELGIHPGIVLGRLQRQGVVPHSRLNHLKLRYDLAED